MILYTVRPPLFIQQPSRNPNVQILPGRWHRVAGAGHRRLWFPSRCTTLCIYDSPVLFPSSQHGQVLLDKERVPPHPAGTFCSDNSLDRQTFLKEGLLLQGVCRPSLVK